MAYELNPFTGRLDKTLPVGMYWNKALKYLGIGGTPSTRLHVKGTTASHIGTFDIGVNYPLVAPPASLGLALVNAPGNINVGQHFYRVTYITAVGETEFNAQYNNSIITDAGHGQVTLTIPVSPDYRVTGRKIYRAVTGVTYWLDVKCVATINNNTDVTYVDNLADANRTGPDSFARGNTTNRQMLVDGLPAMYVGPQNTFLGYRVGEAVLNGTAAGGENTFVGSNVGITPTGSKNVAVGVSIGNIGYSDSCVVLGHGVGMGGQQNIGIGRNVGGYLSYGYYNIAIGGGAMNGTGYYNTNYNTAIGPYCLTSLTNGGANNVVIGMQVAQNITTGVANIIIGSFVNAPSATAWGQLNIGNLIQGTGVYSGNANSSTPNASGGTLDFYAVVWQKRGQKVNRTAVGAGNVAPSVGGVYTVLTDDYIIGKTAILAGGDTVRLPNATTCANQVFVIQDESGTAAGGNAITVSTAGGLINGVATYLITVAYGALKVYSNGTNYIITD